MLVRVHSQTHTQQENTMRILVTLAVAVVLAAVGAIAFAYSGLYDVSARTSHSGPVDWLLSTTSQSSIKRRAATITVPDLSADSLARSGINDYEAMCAGCHGAPGRKPTSIALGLNPPAPDLAKSAQSMSPAELYWVTKHGIKMTGMPSWGASHDDASLWPVVAFMTRLPDLDGDAYQDYLEAASGMGHHADDPEANSDGHDHAESTVNEQSNADQEGHVNGDDSSGAKRDPKTNHDDHDHDH